MKSPTNWKHEIKWGSNRCELWDVVATLLELVCCTKEKSIMKTIFASLGYCRASDEKSLEKWWKVISKFSVVWASNLAHHPESFHFLTPSYKAILPYGCFVISHSCVILYCPSLFYPWSFTVHSPQSILSIQPVTHKPKPLSLIFKLHR